MFEMFIYISLPYSSFKYYDDSTGTGLSELSSVLHLYISYVCLLFQKQADIQKLMVKAIFFLDCCARLLKLVRQQPASIHPVVASHNPRDLPLSSNGVIPSDMTYIIGPIIKNAFYAGLFRVAVSVTRFGVSATAFGLGIRICTIARGLY